MVYKFNWDTLNKVSSTRMALLIKPWTTPLKITGFRAENRTWDNRPEYEAETLSPLA
jgi:hypothetical protein